MELLAVRRAQTITIGQNLFNNPFPIATKWLHGKHQQPVQNANRSNFCGFLGNNFLLHKFDASGFAIETEAKKISLCKQKGNVHLHVYHGIISQWKRKFINSNDSISFAGDTHFTCKLFILNTQLG